MEQNEESGKSIQKPIKPAVKFKSLKQKQKEIIANRMYRTTLIYYLEHGNMPIGDELEKLTQIVYNKVQSYRVSFDEIQKLYLSRLDKYEIRIQKVIESGVTLESVQKTTKVKKTGNRPHQKKNRAETETEPLQDENFFFIAGYTSGGAPYGVTWAEMGLEPWQNPSDEDETEE